MYIWTEKAEKRSQKLLDFGSRMQQVNAGEKATFCGEPIDSEIAEVWLGRGLIEEVSDETLHGN